MCGIAGVWNFKSQRPADPRLIEAMTLALRHRGPDDSGHHVSGSLGFGMRRLSIIDLPGGHQPMANEDSSVQIVFNGEIYNHVALRRELSSLGHQFRSRADTEVVIHGYEQFGTGVLERLNGMFAFALWDARAQRLFMARDRLGIKPLYYAETKDGILFASELKSLLRVPGLGRDLDRQALGQYLALEYIPSPRTPFHGVRKLPPATMLLVEHGAVRTDVYWRLREASPIGSVAEAEEGIRTHLERSVRLQRMADVPVGAFLSGGLDSSALVATLAAVGGGAVHTFSIGFGERGFDETGYARRVADALGTVHREEILRPDCLELFETVTALLDEPFADNSILPTYLVSRVARESVKVALSGDGGDELFGGYDHYKAERMLGWYERVPRWARRSALGLLGAAPGRTATKKHGVRRALARLEDALTYPASLSQARFMVRSSDAVRRGLLVGAAPEETDDGWTEPFAAIIRDSPFREGLARQQFIDVKSFLADDILFKTDRASMAASLEARVPYLDHELVEYAFRIPDAYKLRGLVGKWILRRAFRGRIPERVLRRRKSGFSVPISSWLRAGLSPLAHDLLAPARLRRQGIFDPEPVGRLLDDHQALRGDHGRILWGLVMFQAWWDRNMTPVTAADPMPIAAGERR
jgi:asparagine synthase (glutamine-hydrolysing)